ncbi:MAG TPA: hypothetical protein VHW46_08235 [Terracidiphilus sp.]|jgi:Amt family ammonium transporter|nr:hypothetical protein [Terracidiphilus sp.]
MTAPGSLPFTESQAALALGLLLVAPLAPAGVALLNTGLGRSRSAAQALLGSLLMIAAATLVFCLIGATFADGSAGTEHIFQMAGKPWNWAGTGSWFLGGLDSASPRDALSLLFESLALALAVLVPWGSGADRWRLIAGVAASVVMAGVVFPLFAHWAWGAGWLAQLGTNFSLGAGFLDIGGAASVHVLGGLGALVVIWLVGPRRGKFPKEGLSTAMPGHNAVYILFGCLIAFVGWLGFNMAGAMLWLGVLPGKLPLTAINTLLSAAAAFAATFAITQVRFGKPDASLCANGWLAGLVTSSACASLVTPVEAAFTGLVAGVGIPLLVEFLELAVAIDDPSGAISVHAASGLWGLIAAGIFAPAPGQLLAQLIGVATLLGLALPVLCMLFMLINRFIVFRVDPDGERIGMDLHELGGSAYPEFVVHRDDSFR